MDRSVSNTRARRENARDKEVHSLFWTTARTAKFRKAAVAIESVIPANKSELGRIIEKKVGNARPTSKTIGRFFTKKGTFRYDPQYKTHLCFALCEYYEEKIGVNEDVYSHLLIIIEISDSLKEITHRSIVSHCDDFECEDVVGSLRKKLSCIYAPEGDDHPARPEFPHMSPRYPATPILQIDIKGVPVYLKDESYNPTGSHKDRWAWEQLIIYKNRILSMLEGKRESEFTVVPQLSMISSGTAAVALQSLLRMYGLPSLKVVMDRWRAQARLVEILEGLGAIVFMADLDVDELNDKDVLEITKNRNGDDITTRDVLDPQRYRFYDWLVCEILIEKPNYIFVPFGTGDLYANIVSFIGGLQVTRRWDERLNKLDPKDISKIHVLGATTNFKGTRMDKLYAKFRPTLSAMERMVEKFRNNEIVGAHSGVYEVTDPYSSVAEDLVRRVGVNTEPSGIAGLALLLERWDTFEFSSEDKVLIVNTGWTNLRGQ